MSHQDEVWFGLYRDAMVELEHAKMTGRIGDARTAITERIEKLKEMPGLHAAERQAIEDALNGLKILEREEAKFQEDEQKRIAERALQSLKVLAPKFSK